MAGSGLTINTINKQFDLDIQNYIIVNFDSLVGIIDELGGITVNLTEEEAEYYRQTGMPDITSGDVTLTGSRLWLMRETEVLIMILAELTVREAYFTAYIIKCAK